MNYSVSDDKLFLKAENEHDNAIISELWRHPLITEYTRHARKFMDGSGFLPDELVTSGPKRIDREVMRT